MRIWNKNGEDAAGNEVPAPEAADGAEAAPPAGDPASGGFREKYLRALADLDNVRKRSSSHITASVLRERKDLLTAFLPVLDTLERALALHDGEENDWVRGIQAVQSQMLEVYQGLGVAPMRCDGATFDPHLHEAVAQLPHPEAPPGTILETVQTGYALPDGSLLRPPKVVVAIQG